MANSAVYQRDYRDKHRERVRSYGRKWWANHGHKRKAYTKQLHHQKKAWAIAYKGGRCQLCGYSKCVQALEFHHDTEDKEHDISYMCGHRVANTKIAAELDKCMLVCANCHRELHFKAPKESNAP
jgi:hypothetical protein